MTSLLAALACSILGRMSNERLGVEQAVMCLFLMQLQFSTCDLLTEAKYAEKMQSKPEAGPDLMTFVWFGLQGGGLLATIMVGPLMQHFGPKAPYLLAMLP